MRVKMRTGTSKYAGKQELRFEPGRRGYGRQKGCGGVHQRPYRGSADRYKIAECSLASGYHRTPGLTLPHSLKLLGLILR
jgi:hypothetical protein